MCVCLIGFCVCLWKWRKFSLPLGAIISFCNKLCFHQWNERQHTGVNLSPDHTLDTEVCRWENGYMVIFLKRTEINFQISWSKGLYNVSLISCYNEYKHTQKINCLFKIQCITRINMFKLASNCMQIMLL